MDRHSESSEDSTMTAEDMPDGSRAHEYVFDVKLAATIRLIAANERAAWDAVEK